MVENKTFPHLWIAKVNCNNVSLIIIIIECKKCSEKDNFKKKLAWICGMINAHGFDKLTIKQAKSHVEQLAKLFQNYIVKCIFVVPF